MEQLLGFAVTVVLISASGVMSPGPLFTANVFYGLKDGVKAGLKMALGHTVVEFPLVLLIGFGAFSMESIPEFRIIIAVLGAVGLFAFAGMQFRTIFKHKESSILNTKHSAFVAGILFSALNPFFIIWWFTIGFKLISDSLILWPIWGIGIMFAMHIWMDFVWLGAVGFFAKKGTGILSSKNYKILTIVLSGLLVYFGITFLTDTLTTI